MKRKLYWIIGAPILITFLVCGLTFYAMSKMTIADLIMCSLGEGGIRIPSAICEHYMLNYRMSEKDIRTLSEGPGLGFILNGNNPKEYEIAEAFIARGLDVNGVNNLIFEDITPLHGAVLFNDARMVKFLLNKGADPEIVSEHYGMTALQLAKKLRQARRGGKEKREEIIRILSSQ